MKKDFLSEKTEIRLFSDGSRYNSPLFVAVNGESYIIERGKSVMVPRYIKLAIEESEKQDRIASAEN